LDAPYPFKHELDPDLFALDRLGALFRRAPEGYARAQVADPGEERPAGYTPQVVPLDGTLAEAVERSPLHVSFKDLMAWAPEYAAARDQVLEAAGIDPSARRYAESVVIRVFSPDAVVSLHGDGEIQLDCGIQGRNDWHVFPPSSLSQTEHEGLLHGGQFVPWREMTLFRTFDLHPGDGFAAPPRWPHWIEHPGPDPAVSFEVGFWDAAALRERKVFDMNYLIRKLHVRPVPPGELRERDQLKRHAFDLISLATRRGLEFRGV
jgi:hypothetical protein